ncbi:MAG: hypothetical protein GX564_11615 [Oligosphaeraceae bacterium]|nr:hypothetical protein [Oligosphaeraceae bacterium]
MLVFKCKCGNACSASDNAVGNKIVCPQCQEDIPVPDASDADCALIFCSGDPDGGHPITLLNLQHKINSGELHSFDLIWQANNWLPLGEIYPLPPPPEVYVDDSLPELALNFDDLPAVEGFPGLPNRTTKKKSRIRKARPGKSAPSEPQSLRQKIWQVLRIVAVLAILCWGGIRGGRILNFILKKPSNILVINTFDRDLRAKIMNYDWQECIKSGNVVFADLYVALPCRKKMRFEPLTLPAPASGQETTTPAAEPLSPASLRVPLRPNCDTIVNPGGRGIFGVYDFSQLPELTLQTPELRNLSREIAEGREPVSASKVCQQIQELAAELFIEKRTDEFFSSRDFRTDKLGINRAAFADSGQAPKSPSELPPLSLAYPLQQNLSFKNGSVRFDPDNERTERTIMLTSKEFTPAKGLSVTSGSPRLSFRYDGHGLRLQMTGLKGKVLDQNKKSFDADWNYEAVLQTGKWSCKWTAKYRVQSPDKRKNDEVVLTFPAGNKKK